MKNVSGSLNDESGVPERPVGPALAGSCGSE